MNIHDLDRHDGRRALETRLAEVAKKPIVIDKVANQVIVYEKVTTLKKVHTFFEQEILASHDPLGMLSEPFKAVPAPDPSVIVQVREDECVKPFPHEGRVLHVEVPPNHEYFDLVTGQWRQVINCRAPLSTLSSDKHPFYIDALNDFNRQIMLPLTSDVRIASRWADEHLATDVKLEGKK